MLVGGVVVGVPVGLIWDPLYAPLCGWDAATVIFLLWVWLSTARMDASATADHATQQDPGRAFGDAVLIVAAVASLGAVGVVLFQANAAKGVAQAFVSLLAVASIGLSWATMHTMFMLRYAHLYYTGSDGGAEFNQKVPPQYSEFAYLAFTVGMTFQVSDTQITQRATRTTVLRHALLSYLFGAVIIAATVNVIAGLSSGGK